MALIDRQAALDKFKPWLEVKGYSEGELNMLRAVIYELENLPDAGQEIIRCKECRWNDGTAYCNFHYRNVNGEDFCSWAERKGEEDGAD